ncbi:MAG: FAD-binding oxidoreductase [Anaerolineales bacterium]|nr:FAD-binding oxidoreductase [Anaerolineales bacterium]
MNKRSWDAIIIGGGIHGASLAYHLTLHGIKPLILEKQFLAAGATGRSSGLVRMHYDLELESRLAWISYDYFKHWADRVGGESGFVRTGFMQFVEPESTDSLQANIRMQQKLGIPTLLIGGTDVGRLAPQLFREDIQFAAYEPESGYADPSSCTQAFIDRAREKGAGLIQDCEVLDLLIEGNIIQGVKTNQREYSAPVVVNAAGPWASKIGKLAGLNLPVDTWQHDTMFVRRPANLSADHPTVIDFPNSMYFRPETGGLTLVGLEDATPMGEAPDGDTDRAKPGFVERAIDRICKRIPGMDQGSLHSSHGGYDGITPDQRAILGQAGPEGFYLDCGFSGTGFKIAPAVGVCMAELIVKGKSETADITPFAFSRFESGVLLKGDDSYENIWR